MNTGLIRAVLIDLDGTLVDSVADIAEAIDHTLREVGLKPIGLAGTQPLVGKGAMNLVERALELTTGHRPEAARVEAVHAIFMTHYRESNGKHSAVYGGVVDGLERMKQAGLALGCVTNKPREMATGLLDAMGLSGYFGCVIGGGDTERRKPDPQPLLLACERLGVTPAETVMIGDSANDAEAGRRAGCEVFLVPYGYTEGRSIESMDSDWIVPTLVDAAALLIPPAASA